MGNPLAGVSYLFDGSAGAFRGTCAPADMGLVFLNN